LIRQGALFWPPHPDTPQAGPRSRGIAGDICCLALPAYAYN
jgi:hypothetical protein